MKTTEKIDSINKNKENGKESNIQSKKEEKNIKKRLLL